MSTVLLRSESKQNDNYIQFTDYVSLLKYGGRGGGGVFSKFKMIVGGFNCIAEGKKHIVYRVHIKNIGGGYFKNSNSL